MGKVLTNTTVNAYAVLGVSPEATQAELKAAHRALVRRHHPYLAPDERAEATRRVQEINVAYGLVRDPAHRAEYDRMVAARGETGMDRLVASAGVWAGRWWLRNRVPLRRGAALAQEGLRASGKVARRAAAETVGRVLWLLLCVLGLVLGWLAAWSLQRMAGVSGYVTPLVGTVGGLALGNQRGWLVRLRLAGVRSAGNGPRWALVAWLAALGAGLLLDARLF